MKLDDKIIKEIKKLHPLFSLSLSSYIERGNINKILSILKKEYEETKVQLDGLENLLTYFREKKI